MFKVRILFTKSGPAAYISHLDLLKTLQRSLRRAELPVRYSEGFNPHINMSILVPLSTGYESACDLCDIELISEDLPENLVGRLNAALPHGLRVLAAGAADKPVGRVAYCGFDIRFDQGQPEALQQAFHVPISVEKRSKRGSREVVVQDYVRSIHFEQAQEGGTLCRCVLKAGDDPLNPMYITRALIQVGALPDGAQASYLRTEILDEKGQVFFDGADGTEAGEL